jgi:hypothetical protein
MWQTFGSTFSSQSNTWGDTAAADESFPFFDASILGGTVPLSKWQSAPPDGVGQDSSSKFVPKASAPAQCAPPKPDIPDFWLVLGPRQGAAVIVPQAGGAAAQVSLNLVSLGFTGTVSLTLDTTQAGGSGVSGVSGSFSPAKVSLTPGSPLAPVSSTLTIATTSSTPDGFFPLTVTATDGQSLTRTGTLFLQVGVPSALQLRGTTTIQAGTCAVFQIHSVDAQGTTSEVLDSTYLSATGTGSGQFFQDSHCTTPIDFKPINTGCPAGIEIPPGDYAPHLEGTESIWFMDPKAESLSVTISDEAGVLKPVTAAIQVH